MSKANRLRALFAQLDALYAELPHIVCAGKCSVSCAMVPLALGEAKRLQLVTHKKPRTTDDAVCIYLTAEKRCSAYAVRPLVCRAYGLAKTISCPFGCMPDRWLDEREFIHLAQAIERVAGALVITGPEGLTRAPHDFAAFGTQLRDTSADAERTRNLRALHGGRIMGVTGNPHADAEVNWIDNAKKDEHG